MYVTWRCFTTQNYWCLAWQAELTWLRTVNFSVLTYLSISWSFHSNNFRPHIPFTHFTLFMKPVESQYLDIALSIRFKTNCFRKQHFKVWGNRIRLFICPYFIDSGLVSTRNRIRPEYVYQMRTNHSELYTNQWFNEIDKNNEKPGDDAISRYHKKLASLIICKLNSMAFVEYSSDEFEFQANIPLFRQRRVWCRQNLLNNQKFRMIFRDNLHLDKEPRPGNSWVESER